MDDLPELPFEKVLSYLNLKDRLKARGVSRRWYHKINSFRVKSLCFSKPPLGFALSEKSRLISGAFAQNFISSSRFALFFDTFAKSILSNVKQLRLCHLELNGDNVAEFERVLNSFGQLEELVIFRFDELPNNDMMYPADYLELNLPQLTSIHLEGLPFLLDTLTLDAPKLQNVKLVDCPDLSLNIVHGESVVRLLIDDLKQVEVNNLKNLHYLYTSHRSSIDPTLLSGLGQLKEVHLYDGRGAENLLRQKRQFSLADLKIYLCGLLLNGPDDPAIGSFWLSKQEFFVHLAEQPSRLADEMPLYVDANYPEIEPLAGHASGIDVLSRCTDLRKIELRRPVQDVEVFLNLLKNVGSIEELWFSGAQPQDLFDRLPEHCAVQKLAIFHFTPTDFRFLFRLHHATRLAVCCPIDTEIIRKAFEELPYLSRFEFHYNGRTVAIGLDESSGWTPPKRFLASIDPEPVWRWYCFDVLDDAIQFIVRNVPQGNPL